MRVRFVDVCIATRQRPGSLSLLLEAMNYLQYDRGRVDLQIIVVDNDPKGSARDVCINASKENPLKITYISEERLGISFARNTAIENCRVNSEFVVFIDDDEIPDEKWLSELLLAQEASKSEIVTGPVLPRFLLTPPAWIVKGRFFDRNRHTNHEVIDYARTGNVLISQLALGRLKSQMNTYFDNRLALRGGEDTLLFKQLATLGYKIVWADSALVYEWIPSSRMNIGWLLRRAMRNAQSELFVDAIFSPGVFVGLKGLIYGFGRIVFGILLLFLFSLPALILGLYLAVMPLRMIFRGLGFIMEALGIKYQEYEHIQGF